MINTEREGGKYEDLGDEAGQMEAAEQEVKGLGGDEDDGELKQKAGQSEVEEA